MRKLFLFLLVIIVLIPVGYAAFALSRDNSSDAIVKLLGPGVTPSVCIARMRPHFDRMEDAMTEIAEVLLGSDGIMGVVYGYSGDSEFNLNIETTEGYRELTSEEVETFDPKFERLGKFNYFSPQGFHKQAEYVLAPTMVECGVSALDWARMRLGIDYEREQKPVIAFSNYVYWPSGVRDLDKCVEPLPKPDPVTICQVALNENWSWSTVWAYPYETPE